MEEIIVFKTYNSFEADRIIAAFHDANIPAYKHEHGIGQLLDIAAGVSKASLIDIIVPEGAEDKADEILVNMGLMDPAGTSRGISNDDTPQGKALILDDFAMEYETAVLYLDAEDYLEQFYDFYFFKNREEKLVPAKAEFHNAFAEFAGAEDGKIIAEKTENLFGLPKQIKAFENVKPVADELSACNEGWGAFYVVFDIMFCEYENFTLCFIAGSNN